MSRKFEPPKNRLTNNSGNSFVYHCSDCDMPMIVFEKDVVCYIYLALGPALLCQRCDIIREEQDRISNFKGPRRVRKKYGERI